MELSTVAGLFTRDLASPAPLFSPSAIFTMADVLEINDIETLGDYRLLWDMLLRETPGASFFQTYDWLRVYWEHFGEGQRLRVLIVRAAGKPIGIVPLCVRRREHSIGSVQVLTYPLEDWSTFYGPIGKNQAATLMLAMKHLANSPRDWDEIDLPWVAEESFDKGRTCRAMQHAGLAPHKVPYQTTSFIDMEGSWDDYLQGLDSKVRHEMRRHMRRAEELGQFEFIRHRPEPQRAGDGDCRWDLYDQCEEVSQKSWQAESTTGNTICHAKYRDFYRHCHATASKLGMADLALLKVDGQPVAFSYNYRYEGRVFGLRMGYDANHSIKGLGTALTAYLIRNGFERGDARLELGMGDQKFKQRIRSRAETSSRLTYTPLTAWRPQAVRASRWLRHLTQRRGATAQ